MKMKLSLITLALFELFYLYYTYNIQFCLGLFVFPFYYHPTSAIEVIISINIFNNFYTT